MRIKRRKKVKWIQLNNHWHLKVRLIPLMRVGPGCIWLASMAVSKSKRQINYFMSLRKNTCSIRPIVTGKQPNF